MLGVTSFDEVLSHVRERVATNQVSGGLGLQYWMHAAHCRPEPLTRRTVGRRLVFGGPAPCERLIRPTRNEVRCLSPSPSTFTWRRGARQPSKAALRGERSRHESLEPHARRTRTFGACRSHVPPAPLPPPRSLAHVPCTRATCTRSSCVSLRLCVSLRRSSASGLGSACGHGAGAEPERSSEA